MRLVGGFLERKLTPQLACQVECILSNRNAENSILRKMESENWCKTSIGIPFHNNESTLGNAIRSVFSQSYENWELILLDDGSIDNSFKIAKSVSDPRVKTYRNDKNQGLGSSLNQIALIASSKYLVRMDADDLMHPDRIKKQVEWLEKNTTVDLVGSAVYIIDNQNKPIGIRGRKPAEMSLDKIIENGLLHHPTVCGRTEWFRCNPYDSQLKKAQDFELWCRTYSKSVFDILAEPLLFYREDCSEKVLKKYIASSKVVRKVIKTYGPEECGWLFTNKHIIKSHLKSLVYQICSLLGFQRRLVRRRSKPIEKIEAQVAQKIIKQIRSTKVPGLI